MSYEHSAICQDVSDGLSPADFVVEHLPGTPHPNPMRLGGVDGLFMKEDRRIIYHTVLGHGEPDTFLSFQGAGLHKFLHFKPEDTTVGIVSCGGLCPGLNDVIKSVVYQALDKYNVKRVIGFRYGFYGLTKEGIKHSMILDQQVVAAAHLSGGSILGTSRGPQDVEEMVGVLQDCRVAVLICVGGDGTQRGALALHRAIQSKGLDIAVVGVPKTIDNDIAFIERTFGFDTAVQEGVKALKAALCEARSHLYGIGLVKLMGRNSGFIAAQATLASQAAQICLIPEQPVTFETLCELIEMRFTRRTYCVIVVAEGFGQDVLQLAVGTDASGNKRFGDIGVYLRDRLSGWLKANKDKYSDATVKYIDPSYTVRSCPASSNDSAFCVQLANCALHEAMHGSTACVVGHWAGCFTTVPIQLATKTAKTVDLKGMLWRSVREMTISRRRRQVGIADEDRDCVNAALDPPKDDDPERFHHLWHRAQIVMAAVRRLNTGAKAAETISPALGLVTGGSAENPENAGGHILQHLECKYTQMKERSAVTAPAVTL